MQIDRVEVTGNVDTPVDVSEVQIAKVLGSSRARKSARVNDFKFGMQTIDSGEEVVKGSSSTHDPGNVNYVPPPLNLIFVEGSWGWIAIPVY